MSYGKVTDYRNGVADDAPSTRCVGLGDPDEYAVKRKVDEHLRQRKAMVEASGFALAGAQEEATAMGTLVDRLERLCHRASMLTHNVGDAADRALGIEPANAVDATAPGYPTPNGPAVGTVNVAHSMLDRLGNTLSRLDEQVGRLNRLV